MLVEFNRSKKLSADVHLRIKQVHGSLLISEDPKAHLTAFLPQFCSLQLDFPQNSR
jgi:hypothetical protein